MISGKTMTIIWVLAFLLIIPTYGISLIVAFVISFVRNAIMRSYAEEFIGQVIEEELKNSSKKF
ncbi:MAG: hypothetical protein KGV58_00360 [Campylobacteraceae bacterium]|nr:hypothetical protein [Campylobacteraceae bacterium]